jgi:hypothetical protein
VDTIASSGFDRIQSLSLDQKVPKYERDQVRRDLLDYCHRDALAMVRLVETLEGWPELIHDAAESG